MAALAALLGVRPGVTAIIGSGGKTTLLQTLSAELPGSVILTTTTHIFPFAGLPCLPGDSAEAISQALRQSRVVCVGTPAAEGKLTAPALPFFRLSALADYILVEADGAHRQPLKAHADDEPVLPVGTGRVILVAGATGFGKTIAEAVHRPAQFAKLVDTGEQTLVTPTLAGQAIAAEHLADIVFLNQLDAAGQAVAAHFATPIPCPVVAGSLQRGLYRKIKE